MRRALERRMTDANPATAKQILDLLGDVPPEALERLLATGASIHEIAAAAVVMDDDDALADAPGESSRIREICAILEEHVVDRIDDAGEQREIAHT